MSQIPYILASKTSVHYVPDNMDLLIPVQEAGSPVELPGVHTKSTSSLTNLSDELTLSCSPEEIKNMSSRNLLCLVMYN